MMRPYEQLFTWPNILTLVRISLIPLLVLFFYLPFSFAHSTAAFIFALAAVTDWLDGYLARYLKQTTMLGAFLDPVADKLIVCIALIMIVAEPMFQFVSGSSNIVTLPTAVITIPAAVIVAREIFVSALREWMAEMGKRASVAVSNLGKIKTAVQMLALTILLYCDSTTKASIVFIGYLLLYIAAVLTIWSMFYYVKAAWIQINSSQNA